MENILKRKLESLEKQKQELWKNIKYVANSENFELLKEDVENLKKVEANIITLEVLYSSVLQTL